MRLGYARVSSKHQADTEALDQQISRLEKAGAEKILFDVESGRKDSRKNFNQIITLAKNGVATEIIVTRLDRLGRTVVGIHRAIEAFQKAGVKLTILDSPLGDTNSAFGWLTVNNIAGLAEFESRLLSERVRHGTEYYRSNLKYFGKPPFGYIKDENSKLIPHPQQWAIAKEIIRRLYSNSFNSISRWLLETHGIKMHSTTFRKLLHNPALRGHTFYDLRNKDKETQREYNTHEALITEKQYEELAQIFSQFDKKDPAKFKPHILPGILKCGLCGYSMSQTRGGTQYQCANYKRFGARVCTNGKTISKKITRAFIANELTKYASEITEQFKSSKRAIPTEDENLLDLQHKLKTLESISGSPAVDAAILDFRLQIKNYDYQQKVRDTNTEEDLLVFKAFLQADFWEGLSDTEFKLTALRFLEEVTFDGGREFSFSFRSISRP
jgi:site-specific DNA recombinase